MYITFLQPPHRLLGHLHPLVRVPRPQFQPGRRVHLREGARRRSNDLDPSKPSPGQRDDRPCGERYPSYRRPPSQLPPGGLLVIATTLRLTCIVSDTRSPAERTTFLFIRAVNMSFSTFHSCQPCRTSAPNTGTELTSRMCKCVRSASFISLRILYANNASTFVPK